MKEEIEVWSCKWRRKIPGGAMTGSYRCGANGSQNALPQRGLIVFVCCTARENPEGVEGPSFRWCRYSVRPSILHISCSSRVSVKSLFAVGPWSNVSRLPQGYKSVCISFDVTYLLERC
jgi:hypothetical protein